MFKKLDFLKPSTYQTNSAKDFVPTAIPRKHLEISFSFAYDMSFGHLGHHRDHRTGGTLKRKNGEIFINAFQGKVAEFAFYDWLKNHDITTELPDVSLMGKGFWDDSDFTVNEKKISIKSAAHFSNLMLLETKDWDSDANYIPNIDTGNASYDYFVLTRIKPDGKKLMKQNNLFYAERAQRNDLKKILAPEKWSADVTGFATKSDLQFVISQQHIIPKRSLLNGTIPMDASNYYLQSGNLRPIGELVGLLV